MANQSGLRIKGQEVQVIITRGGVLEDTITAIKSFELTDVYQTLDQGYLGEKTNRKDYIFNGSKFSMELHLSRKQWWVLKRAIKDKAQRKTPDVVFSVSAVFNFPNGETKAETIPDISFSEIPQRVPGRGEFVAVTLAGEVEDTTEQDL